MAHTANYSVPEQGKFRPLPKRLADRSILTDFDPAILGPIANIKESELAM
jgi:hypothetical protein